MEGDISEADPDLDAAIFIALGSNLAGAYEAPQALLEEALLRFPGAGIRVRARSRWWRSAAWPDATQPAFVNGVAQVETDLGPRPLLARMGAIEAAFGRVRSGVNAPRTLDLDLIAHGRSVIVGGKLTLPHPRAHERVFMMGPLAEIAPDWRHPLLGWTAAELARGATVGSDAAPNED